MGKLKKKLGFGALGLFVSLNAMAFWHAYSFTHFQSEDTAAIPDPMEMSFWQKAKVLIMGAKLPSSPTETYPKQPYQDIYLSNEWKNACWYLPNEHNKGVVILLHGYGSEKSKMLGESDVWQSLGYSTFLMDFGGSGASLGHSTSIGYHEAAQVRDAYQYVSEQHPGKPIVLGGASMGAVALLRATSVYALQPLAIIAECPYASLRRAVHNRFENMGVPRYPFADMLLFWGGVQQGYNTFDVDVKAYAANIHCPALIMRGGIDERVAADEVAAIYEALQGPKKLITYPLAGHENYLNKYRAEWTKDIKEWEAGL